MVPGEEDPEEELPAGGELHGVSCCCQLANWTPVATTKSPRRFEGPPSTAKLFFPGSFSLAKLSISSTDQSARALGIDLA
jgi:hypothetical protein